MPAVLNHRVGTHATVAGGLAKGALPYIDATNAEAVQVFVSSPRAWALPEGDPRQDEAFVAGCEQRRIPVYVHASYLVNLGSPTAATVEKSAATLAHAVRRGAAIGAKGVVFHAGSAVDEGHAPTAMRQMREVLLPVLDQAAETGDLRLLVEPTAGGGRSLAARIEDLAPYFEAVDWHPALGVCFDTCHIWAAGHELAKPGGMTSAFDDLAATVGADRLGLIHANDSRDACGSLRDRHETIGAGTIGEAAFVELLHLAATKDIPSIVETPSKGWEGHAADVATLTRLRKTRPRRTRR
jgi:deoxyribonuclease-4